MLAIPKKSDTILYRSDENNVRPDIHYSEAMHVTLFPPSHLQPDWVVVAKFPTCYCVGNRFSPRSETSFHVTVIVEVHPLLLSQCEETHGELLL